MTLVDTHAHLDFPQFDADRESVLDRADAAGVGTIVNVGADLASSQRALALAASHPRIYAAVGIHPHDAKDLDGTTLSELGDLAGNPKVVAVGEIGLDYYRDRSPRDVQRWAFQTQLDWAAKLGKPVIIHDRNAHEEILAMLSEWAPGMKNTELVGRLGVLHTFSGDLTMAQRAIELGFYISISGPVTYRNAHQLPEIVRALPLERLLLETDCPYLTPEPYRGKRNEPAYIRLVGERIAALKGISLLELARVTTANAQRLFGFEV